MEWFAKENLWPHSKTVVGAILTVVALFEFAGLFAMIPWTLWIGFTVLFLAFATLRMIAKLIVGSRKTTNPKPINYIEELVKDRPLP